MSYCLGYNIRDILLNIYSELLQIFLNYYGFVNNTLSSGEHYQNVLDNLTYSFKEYYHSFTTVYIGYNLKIGYDLNFLYKRKKFKRIRGFWQEIDYYSQFSKEIDIIIYDIFRINVSNKDSIDIKKDLKNFPFFKGRKERKEKVNTNFIKLLYYLCANYEFVYKDLFYELETDIYNNYIKYDSSTNIICNFLEIFGIILCVIFYITVNIYLYFSNVIIIKNLIFLFLDIDEEDYNKNKENSNLISLKLLEFRILINDFDINNFDKYSKNIENLNQKKYNLQNKLINNDINKNFNINNDNKNTNDNNNDKNERISKVKTNFINNKLPIQKKINNKNSNNNKFKSFGKSILFTNNNSSNNYLVDSWSNFFKNNLNDNKNMKNEIISNNNSNSNNFSSQNMMNSTNNINNKSINLKKNNSFKKEENEEIERQKQYKDIILNKSNKNTILIIKIFYFIIGILIFLIIGFNFCKIIIISSFSSTYKYLFKDFDILTNRYTMLFYYFNILRTLFIFPEDERKKKLVESMDNMTKTYEEENEKFGDVLLNGLNNYNQIKKLFNVLTDTRNNLTDYIKEKICLDIEGCRKYLDSEFNIFSSGIDFGLKTCMTQIGNIYTDYKNLPNKTNIRDINDSLIHNPHFKFIKIGNSINNMFIYVKEKIFNYFRRDLTSFNNYYCEKITLLNVISIIGSILIFLFVIIIFFVSISRFNEPIKDSTYRINLSLYYIKKYSLTN